MIDGQNDVLVDGDVDVAECDDGDELAVSQKRSAGVAQCYICDRKAWLLKAYCGRVIV